jgi:hypothetical protein
VASAQPGELARPHPIVGRPRPMGRRMHQRAVNRDSWSHDNPGATRETTPRWRPCGCRMLPPGRMARPPRIPRRVGPQENEDLLTERPTLAIPRLGHNAQADLLRKQQVLGSNPSVGSSSPSRSESPGQTANLVAGACHNAEGLLTDRIQASATRYVGVVSWGNQ